MARPTAADRIADLTAELDQQRTRAEAAEAELREVKAERDNLEAANRKLRDQIDAARDEVLAAPDESLIDAIRDVLDRACKESNK